MSCLDVMYQVYGPPQPYFAAAYTPYHQKLAYYSKMQEAQECNTSPSNSSSSGSSSFSSQTPANIKEEEGSPEKERPPEAEYINSRCVLFTYFQGDISSVVDEHFSRALSQPSSYSPSCTSSKAPRSSGPWRDGSFPMSQRSFPASFWNSAYQAPVPAPLGSPLATAHSELPFAAADPYSPAGLHGSTLSVAGKKILRQRSPFRELLGSAHRASACWGVKKSVLNGGKRQSDEVVNEDLSES
ncbi:transcription cofactor vestigial-like protein 2 [Suricata suricatta]|nr:transcription cofactor vestigial-like protein 2 [Suricata suricatta]